MDKLLLMRIFARVVELGGFTGAAESLGITKSTVSRGMRALARIFRAEA
jgi:DNA-binding transcriptional LysR family regulator